MPDSDCAGSNTSCAVSKRVHILNYNVEGARREEEEEKDPITLFLIGHIVNEEAEGELAAEKKNTFFSHVHLLS